MESQKHSIKCYGTISCMVQVKAAELRHRFGCQLSSFCWRHLPCWLLLQCHLLNHGAIFLKSEMQTCLLTTHQMDVTMCIWRGQCHLLNWLRTDKLVPRFGSKFCSVPGGALELKQCFWYLVYWQWVQWVNGWPKMCPNISCPGIIALTSGKVPNYQVIPRLEVWEARQTLGVHPAPDGNYQKEGEFLLNKGNWYGNWLATSNLSEMDTFIFHRSTYTP